MERGIRLLLVAGSTAGAALSEGLAARRERWTVTTVASADAALARLAEEAFDCVLIAERPPERDTTDVLAAIHIAHPGLPVIVRAGDEVGPEAALAAGAAECVPADCAPSPELVATRVEHVVASAAQSHGGTVDADREPESVAQDGDALGRAAGADRERADGADPERTDAADGRTVEELRREYEQYRTLVDEVGDPMYVLDAEGHLTMVNRALAEHIGRPREELLGEHVAVLMPEEDIERGKETIRELLQDPERRWASFEMRVQPDDGEETYNENKIAVLVEDGEFVGSVGVVRDITDRKAYEEELERQNRRLNEFASIVSHDLRNPLSVAEGRLDLLEGECDSEHVEEIAWALDRMRDLVEDLLTLARQGQTLDDLEPVRLAHVATAAWETVDPADAELAVETDATVRADPGRLRQVFENLLRNALEHAADAPTVTVGDLPDATGFFVADDGPGVPPAERADVFEHGYTTAEDGTGYGLPIVVEIASAHGWDVELTDAETGGARFEFGGVEVVDGRPDA